MAAWREGTHAGRDMPWAFVLCLAVSLMAHALLLGMRVEPAPSRPRAQASSEAAGTMHVRMVRPEQGATGLTTGQVDAPRAAPAEAQREVPAGMKTATPTPKHGGESAPAVPTEPTSNLDSLGPSANSQPMGADRDQYIPRPMLSVVPVVQTPVLLVAPAGETQIARHVGILSLFIDEEGVVRRIAAGEPRLPPAFEQAAREAFMAARFAPGQVDGQLVKSRVRVEVVFDNTPLL